MLYDNPGLLEGSEHITAQPSAMAQGMLLYAESCGVFNVSNMAQLFECRCGNGRLMFSSMGLQNLQCYPEARALLASVYDYLESEAFAPEQVADPDTISGLVD